jgi:hypothetical protein
MAGEIIMAGIKGERISVEIKCYHRKKFRISNFSARV